MKPGAARYKDMPLEIAGSTVFGRYPKISVAQTYNMILSDGFLVDFAGYRNVKEINNTGQGRAIYASTKLNKMYVVIDNDFFVFDNNLSYSLAGRLSTFVGDVYISQNNAGQIAISDSINIYIYDTTTSTFSTATIDFKPGYLTFQNGRFISPDLSSNDWRLSEENNGLSWPNDSQHVGELQTKPDNAVACIRFPGRGNLLLVFGKTVAEPWYDVGAQLFPYQRSPNSNFDYGCLNPSTIAENENMVCWLSANEKSGPVISYTNGDDIKHISTDGINYKLANLTNPTNVYGFMFKQDGHLFYVLTWIEDNLSYAYDFNTQKFFTLCDENQNAFIVKRVAFFNNQYYFVSINDGNLYQLSSRFSTYDYGTYVREVPRIRVLPPIRMPDQSRFVAGYAGFTIEQGQIASPSNATNNLPRIDMCLSKDGGQNFGSNVSKQLNPLGVRRNRLFWWRLGQANDLTIQYRFWGFGRFVATDGIVGVRE